MRIVTNESWGGCLNILMNFDFKSKIVISDKKDILY